MAPLLGSAEQSAPPTPTDGYAAGVDRERDTSVYRPEYRMVRNRSLEQRPREVKPGQCGCIVVPASVG